MAADGDLELRFPDGFRWGVATSSHQCEGAAGTAVEHLGALGGARPRAGRQPQRQSRATGGRTRSATSTSRATSSLTALRMTVDWARVEPEIGRFDDAALARYREMVVALRERGIEPMVTPAPLRPAGVVRGPGRVREPGLGGAVPALRAPRRGGARRRLLASGSPSTSRTSTRPSGYVLGDFPPGPPRRHAGPRCACRRNMARAHAARVRADPRAGPGRVRLLGAAPDHVRARPARRTRGDRWAARLERPHVQPRRSSSWSRDGRTSGPPGLRIDVPEMQGTCDFVGINLYGRRRVRFSLREWRSAFNRVRAPAAGRAARRPGRGGEVRRALAAGDHRVRASGFARARQAARDHRERLRGRARPRAPVGDRGGGAPACTT